MHPVKSKHQQVAALDAAMVRCVRERGGCSRVELARELKLAPSTAGIYVDRLVREGFLLESATERRPVAGRPSAPLRPNPDRGRFIGVDFEARSLTVAAVDFSQAPLRHAQRAIAPGESVGQILAKIERAIAAAIESDPRPVLGIGVGVPGLIDPVTHVAVHYDFIHGWDQIRLGARLEARFGVPVFLENNIRSMALAELWFGAAKGLRNFVCVGIRSGVAAGVVVDGQLLHGARYRAGEIGHWTCPVPPELAPQGAERGVDWGGPGAPRLEHVASLSALAAAAQRGVARGRRTSLAAGRGSVTADRVVSAARAGDAYARSLVRAAGRVHGWVAHQLRVLFNPERLVFAGPLADPGLPFMEAVCGTARGLDDAGDEADIVPSTLGRANGAIGAAALALHQWRPVR